MKTRLLFTILFLLSLNGFSQSPQQPSGIPGKPGLPAPKNLRLLSDLTVTCNNVGSTKTGSTTRFTAKLTIYNRGAGESGPVKLKALISPNPGMKPTTSKPTIRYYGDTGSMGTWCYCSSEPEIASIAAGRSLSIELSFEIPAGECTREKYVFFSVLADYYKATTESNETNNVSAPVMVLNRL